MENNTIPNLKIKKSGSKKSPTRMVMGIINLPCWNGYFLATEPNYLIKTRVVTNGEVELIVDAEITANEEIKPLDEQVNAYTYLLEHQEGIKVAIVEALKREFPNLLETEYAAWDHDHEDFPKLSQLNEQFDFKDYVGPHSVWIAEDVKDDCAYLQWRFLCRWDEEHGLDIITHKERVIEIAPEADPWKIAKDKGTYEEEYAAYKTPERPIPKVKQKKWWQFWL